MEMKTIITVVIAGMLGAIVFSSMLPVFAETTSATNTFTNEGYYTMDRLTEDSSFTLTWDYTKPSIITVDGMDYDLSNVGLTKWVSYTIFGSDNFVLRYRITDTDTIVQYYGPSSASIGFMYASILSSSNLSVTVDEGNATFSTTNTSYTEPSIIDIDVDKAYCINTSNNGDYVMKKSNESVYVVEDSTIVVLAGITSTLPNTDVGIYATGTINDNLNASAFRGTNTYDVTFNDFEYTTSNVNNYVGLVELSKVDFIATQNNTDYNVTYSYFIVPSEVTAEKVNHVEGPIKAIMDLLPILIGIGLVIGIAGVVLARRF